MLGVVYPNHNRVKKYLTSPCQFTFMETVSLVPYHISHIFIPMLTADSLRNSLCQCVPIYSSVLLHSFTDVEFSAVTCVFLLF